MTNKNTMTLSLLSSLLLLGSAAADRNNIFGRSVHKRSSPLKRIRRAERKTSLVTEEVTTIKAPRILTEDGVQKKPNAEIATVEDARILIEDGVQTETSTSRVLNALSSMPLSFEFSMSSMIHFEEMSMSMLDFSMPSIEPPTDATPTPSAVVPPATTDPNMDLASLFAKALVSDIHIGAPHTIESTLTLFRVAPSFSSLKTSSNAPVWILPRTLAWCPRSLPFGSGASGPADNDACTLPTA